MALLPGLTLPLRATSCGHDRFDLRAHHLVVSRLVVLSHHQLTGVEAQLALSAPLEKQR